MQVLPNHFSLYKLSLELYKIYNQTRPTYEWVYFVSQITITGRQTKFEISKTDNYKIGQNALSNKLACLNKQIELESLDQSFASFKREMKTKFKVG
jgi:hypothetical protein